jgi:hypothetical protein
MEDFNIKQTNFFAKILRHPKNRIANLFDFLNRLLLITIIEMQPHKMYFWN